MTDITELAQRMKAAAQKAKQANDLYLEGKITLSECAIETKGYLDYSDNPNNILALVEALEMAQQERDNWRTSFDNKRFRADNLASVLNYEIERAANVRGQLLIAHRTLLNQQAKISELESRTVKLPNQTDFDDPLSAYEAIEKFKEALTTAGIKWEAE
ncbi:hypothetical protein [Entomohabitans teleogrylli]|uniref:hypothetical protein n=1 Tax=Entomohabitans teleogrylli TaxID=1384589 RepID=UPI00073DA9BE|nr:hypothetical protein [Entomohabitans teleogrylli]